MFPVVSFPLQHFRATQVNQIDHFGHLGTISFEKTELRLTTDKTADNICQKAESIIFIILSSTTHLEITEEIEYIFSNSTMFYFLYKGRLTTVIQINIFGYR